VNYSVLEIKAKVEPFENGRGVLIASAKSREAEGKRELKVADEVAGTHPEGFGNLYQGINGGGFLTAFQFSHVIVVEVGFLREPFLTHARVFSI